MFHCFTFFLVIRFCILRLSLNTPALCPLFHGVSPQGEEKFYQPFVWDNMVGSPPRGRGKVKGAAPPLPRVWITPAWAGKRQRPAICWTLQGDHPRVGGEKPTSSAHCQGPSGSPPRGRGKVRRGHSDDCCCGITPAWAGKRTLPDLREAANGDHPRVGGEKLTIKEKYLWQRGSPPRGRGKDLTDTRHLRGLRITPAWAGKRLKRFHRSGIFISGPIPFHSVLHRPAGSGGSRAGRDGSPAGQPQNTGPA